MRGGPGCPHDGWSRQGENGGQGGDFLLLYRKILFLSFFGGTGKKDRLSDSTLQFFSTCEDVAHIPGLMQKIDGRTDARTY